MTTTLDRERVSSLVEWCDKNGILLDPRTEISLETHGWAVRVTPEASLDEGDLVAALPQNSFLTRRLCSAPHALFYLDPTEGGKLAPTLELALCVLWEFLLGATSRWWGYLYSLPDVQPLPPFWAWDYLNPPPWEAEMMRLLRGTEVEAQCVTRAQFARQDVHAGLAEDQTLCWRSIQTCLSPGRMAILQPSRRVQSAGFSRTVALRDLWRDGPGEEGWPYALACCCALVSSRSFVLDEIQGLAMCPIADVFNHLPPGRNAVQLEFGDTFEEEVSAPDDHTAQWAVMRCTCAVGPDEEVFNTYGALDPASLLCRYGFVLNPELPYLPDAYLPDAASVRLDGATQTLVSYAASDASDSDLDGQQDEGTEVDSDTNTNTNTNTCITCSPLEAEVRRYVVCWTKKSNERA